MTEPPVQGGGPPAPPLHESMELGPDPSATPWWSAVPPRPACFLLEGREGHALLLATVRNLRAALKRRFTATHETTRRIDYGAVVRRVRWRTVHSRFEADWVYLEQVRRLRPHDLPTLASRWRTWWVAVNLEERHPRWRCLNRPARPFETCFGPIRDGRSGRRLVATMEDLFDLCRYHRILLQAPHGAACAYKQMQRCPAPCDGTVSMEAYRRQVRGSLQLLEEPQAWCDRLRRRMEEAAAALRFEEAERLKQRRDRASRLLRTDPPLRRLRDLVYVTAQRGCRPGTARLFLAHPAAIHPLGEVDAHAEAPPVLGPTIEAESKAWAATENLPEDASYRIGLIGRYLLGEEREPGIFLGPAEATDPQRLRAALRAAARPTGSAGATRRSQGA